MDEPFSAVDPVVREDLQTEMLRLQSELKKTIVFVTHDIDEAVKLGDHIAVFGPGGRLQQVAAPRDVLAAPATDFVAGFVGRDRGYRGIVVPRCRRGSVAPCTHGRRERIEGSASRIGRMGSRGHGQRNSAGMDRRDRRRRPALGTNPCSVDVCRWFAVLPPAAISAKHSMRQSRRLPVSALPSTARERSSAGSSVPKSWRNWQISVDARTRNATASPSPRDSGRSGMRWLIDNFSTVVDYSKTHLYLALLPLLIGLLIAVPVGTAIRNVRWLRRITLTLASIAFTIPSLALFVTIPPVVRTQDP